MIQSVVLFMALSALFACGGATVVGHLTPVISAGAFFLALIFCLYERVHRGSEKPLPPTGLWSKVLYIFVVYGIYVHSMFLFYMKDNSTYWIQDISNLGDLSFHWNVIKNLASGASFWPDNPIFLGHRFRYPFGMDMLNAMLDSLGVAIETHLPAVTMGTLVLTMAALHWVGGPLLVFAVFFSAGLYNYLDIKIWNIYEIQKDLDFKNLFLSVLIPQRGMVYALPAGLLLYHRLESYFRGERKLGRIETLSLGIIWGGLGFFHLHSYVIVSGYLGFLILWKRALRPWMGTLLIALILGLPFVVIALLPEEGTRSLIHWSRGWARPENVNYLVYWIVNMGPWLLSMLVSVTIFYRQRNWNDLVRTGLALVFFAIFAHLILAPWAWDNIKLILWCYIFGLLAIRNILWTERPAWFRLLVFVVFCLPGFLIFAHSLPNTTRGTSWVSERELNKARVLLRGQDVNQGMLIEPTYDHPALLLGYKLYMGYPGHVWSHGYDYMQREQVITSYFLGEIEGLPRLPKGQVRLIYRGPLEKRREKEGYSTKGLFKVGEALDHELYRLD